MKYLQGLFVRVDLHAQQFEPEKNIEGLYNISLHVLALLNVLKSITCLAIRQLQHFFFQSSDFKMNFSTDIYISDHIFHITRDQLRCSF